MARPTVVPRWASDGAADVVTPSAGKQDVGWIDAEEPAAEYVNWLGLHGYNWQQYLDAGGHATKFKSVGLANGNIGSAAGWAYETSFARWIETTVDGSQWYVEVPFEKGDTIVTFRARVIDGGASNLVHCFLSYNLEGTSTLIASSSSTGTGALETVTDVSYTERKLGDFETVNLRIQATGGGAVLRKCYAVEIEYRNDND